MALAIIGSGPAGIYLADGLARRLPGCRIDIYERLALPFGLARFGVAPDHTGTRAIMKLFERTLQRENVLLHSGVEVGTAGFDLERMRKSYDAVIVATGAGTGRHVAIDGGQDAPSVTGIDFARMVNGHPDVSEIRLPARAPSICIIGNGNVSLDVARLLSTPAETLIAHGVSFSLARRLEALGVQEINICGRGSAGRTKFSPDCLVALRDLPGFQPLTDALDFGASVHDERSDNLGAHAVLREFSHLPATFATVPIRFQFGLELLQWDNGMLTVRHPVKGIYRIQAALIVHAIGNHAAPLVGLPYDAARGFIPNVDGRVMGIDRVFVAGWAAGAGGVIAAARANAQKMVPQICADLTYGRAQSAVG